MPIPPPALPGRGLYSAESGSRSQAAGSVPTCELRCGARCPSDSRGEWRAGAHETAGAAASRWAALAYAERVAPSRLSAAPHPTLPPSRNLRQVDNSCRGRPARAISAAYPSPGLRGVPSGGGGGGLAMRAARVA